MVTLPVDISCRPGLLDNIELGLPLFVTLLTYVDSIIYWCVNTPALKENDTTAISTVSTCFYPNF